MDGRCSRWRECDSFRRIGCEGCGFQHFDNILMAHEDNEVLKSLGDEYFRSCSTRRKGPGGRVSIDKPIEGLFLRRIPKLKKVPSTELRVKLPIDREDIDFEVKCDAAFEVDGKYVFYEVKGYGDNTNDVLSAITAAQLLKEVPKYKDSLYYYIGISSGKKGDEWGLRRVHFFEEERTKISPYVKWAESKGLLKFYGIVDIERLLDEVKNEVQGGDFI